MIVDHSTGIGAGDDVVIALPPVAEELAVALHELCGDRGATPLSDQLRPGQPAFVRAADGFETPEHELAPFEETDAFVLARGGANVSEEADVSPERNAAHRRATRPVQEERLSKRWCLTQFPSPGHAQLAGTSTEGYETFVYDAVTLDWAAQREHQARMKQRLDEASEVRIRSGEGTDLTMSVAGSVALDDHGEKNLPGGEVFTAPVRDSVEGEVQFDMPLYRKGQEIDDVRLRFEDGRVESFGAGRNEAVLEGILETDEGARYLGELGIGTNRNIDRFSYKLFSDNALRISQPRRAVAS